MKERQNNFELKGRLLLFLFWSQVTAVWASAGALTRFSEALICLCFSQSSSVQYTVSHRQARSSVRWGICSGFCPGKFPCYDRTGSMDRKIVWWCSECIREGTCGYQRQIALSKWPGLGEFYVYEDSYTALRRHVNKVRKLWDVFSEWGYLKEI